MDFKEHIQKTLIQPNYITEIEGFLYNRRRLRDIGLGCKTISKILLGIGGVISFAAGVYSSTTLSFVAGSVSTVSLVALQFSSFSLRESQRSTEELNVMLTTLQIDKIPEVLKDEHHPFEKRINESVNELGQSGPYEKEMKKNELTEV
jgi:hypothetical protein